MNKYETLVEYVNNDEDAKAAELFHEIVVENSRKIYESLIDSEMDLGGDEADELINDISVDEEGMREDEYADDMGADDMGAEEGGMEMDGEGGMEMDGEEGEGSLEDRVVDLEDELDALIAAFDSEMGDGEEGMEMGDEEGMEMDDEYTADEQGEIAGMDAEAEVDMESQFNEALNLSKVTKGISNSSESEGTNKTSVNANNSGAKGAVAKPQQSKDTVNNGAPTPTVKPGDGTTSPKQNKVTEPKKKGEDAGVNKKSLNGS